MRYVKVALSQDDFAELESVSRGYPISQVIKRLVWDFVNKKLSEEEHQARILKMLERKEASAKAKLAKVPGAIGRPPDSAETKRFKTLTRLLQETYLTLRRDSGSDYEGLYGESERRLGEIVESKNLEELERFEKEKPWLMFRL